MDILLENMTTVMSLVSRLLTADVAPLTEEGKEIIPFKNVNTIPFSPILQKEISIPILRNAVLSYCHESGHATSMALVSKAWYNYIKAAQPSSLTYYKVPHNTEESCLIKILGNAKLTYLKKNGESVIIPFSSLNNPLEGRFDLKNCDNAGKYLSILTGPQKLYYPENATKVEIRICLRNIIKKHFFDQYSKYFSDWDYFCDWKINTPVAIFWNWGGSRWASDCEPDYLTTETLKSISENNLQTLWKSAKRSCWIEPNLAHSNQINTRHIYHASRFQVSFGQYD